VRRVARATLITGLGLAIVAAGVLSVVDSRARAPRTSTPASPFYLAIGASASLGMQPTGVLSRRARETVDGYANDLVRFEGLRGVTFTLTKIGCPGETPASMLDPVVGDQCHAAPVTQLSVAVAFLRAHRGDRGLVTIDLGFNDLRPCLADFVYDPACLSAGLASVRRSLPAVVDRLVKAAGPRVVFVGLNSFDPFLARLVQESDGASVAAASLHEFDALNAELDAAYTSRGVTVADVYHAFDSANAAPKVVPTVGSVPTNVANVCAYTWMCEPAPFGPDDHPNNAGYMVIAQAISRVLPGRWRDDPGVDAAG
jgi:lysophospholipase L1-like esterase